MKNFGLLLIILAFSSCVDHRGLQKQSTFLENTTLHEIKIFPFKNGIILTDSVKTLQPKSIVLLQVEKTNGLGRAGAETFPPSFTMRIVADSVVVTFDGSRRTTHRVIYNGYSESTFFPNKARSLYNFENYKITSIKEEKYDVERNATYTFTEQDYLDAK